MAIQESTIERLVKVATEISWTVVRTGNVVSIGLARDNGFDHYLTIDREDIAVGCILRMRTAKLYNVNFDTNINQTVIEWCRNTKIKLDKEFDSKNI